jgi:hypothetical protein
MNGYTRAWLRAQLACKVGIRKATIRNQDAQSDSLVEPALGILSNLSDDECAHAYVQMNCFQWPDALISLKPDGWDAMTKTQRYDSSEMQQVWHAIHLMTSAFNRSRQWWREKLIQTDDQHLKWWRSIGTIHSRPAWLEGTFWARVEDYATGAAILLGGIIAWSVVRDVLRSLNP